MGYYLILSRQPRALARQKESSYQSEGRWLQSIFLGISGDWWWSLSIVTIVTIVIIVFGGLLIVTNHFIHFWSLVIGWFIICHINWVYSTIVLAMSLPCLSRHIEYLFGITQVLLHIEQKFKNPMWLFSTVWHSIPSLEHMEICHMSDLKPAWWLSGMNISPRYCALQSSHKGNPCSPTRIQWNNKGVLNTAHVILWENSIWHNMTYLKETLRLPPLQTMPRKPRWM